jgi:protease IV
MEKRSALYGVLTFAGLLILSFLFIAVLLKTTRDEESGGWGPPPKGQKRGPRIGIVELSGLIRDAMPFVRRMHALRNDPDIAAILVRIDSPGGAVAPSQEMAEAVRRARKDKKVVCSMGTLAASGGYYVAAQCDHVVASPGTITGSIGVISETPKVDGLLALAHVKFDIYKSGELKDAGSPLRPTTESERVFFQGFVMRVYEQFLTDVVEGRGGKITLEKLRPIADGRILTGKEALEVHLVDQLGNFETALDKAGELSGKGGAPEPVFPPEHGGSLFERLAGRAAGEAGRALVGGMHDAARPRQQILAQDPAL